MTKVMSIPSTVMTRRSKLSNITDPHDAYFISNDYRVLKKFALSDMDATISLDGLSLTLKQLLRNVWRNKCRLSLLALIAKQRGAEIVSNG